MVEQLLDELSELGLADEIMEMLAQIPLDKQLNQVEAFLKLMLKRGTSKHAMDKTIINYKDMYFFIIYNYSYSTYKWFMRRERVHSLLRPDCMAISVADINQKEKQSLMTQAKKF